MILNCAIVDDEPLALDLLQSYVEKTPFLNLKGKYNNAIQAMEALSDGNSVQLLFLDIQMPGLNGLEFSKLVSNDIRIVFTTAFSQYAIDSYKVNALDYLLKPINYADFLAAAQKALNWFELQESSNNQHQEDEQFIYVKSDYKLIQVSLDNILYIEGLKDYVKIHLENDTKAILSLISMKALEAKLPTERFIRIHRSYIVQKCKIKVIDRGRIVFGKNYIPISESYKQEIQNYINSLSV